MISVNAYLVFAECVDECLQDEAKVGHQLCAGLLLQGRKRRACSLLHALVCIQNTLQQLSTHTHIDQMLHIIHHRQSPALKLYLRARH